MKKLRKAHDLLGVVLLVLALQHVPGECRKKKSAGFSFDSLLSGMNLNEKEIFKEELEKEVKKFHIPSKHRVKSSSYAKPISNIKRRKVKNASKQKVLEGICDPICEHQCVHGCDFRCCVPHYQVTHNIPRPLPHITLPGACSPTCSPTCAPECSAQCCSGGPNGMFQSSLDLTSYPPCPSSCPATCFPQCTSSCCSSNQPFSPFQNPSSMYSQPYQQQPYVAPLIPPPPPPPPPPRPPIHRPPPPPRRPPPLPHSVSQQMQSVFEMPSMPQTPIITAPAPIQEMQAGFTQCGGTCPSTCAPACLSSCCIASQQQVPTQFFPPSPPMAQPIVQMPVQPQVMMAPLSTPTCPGSCSDMCAPTCQPSCCQPVAVEPQPALPQPIAQSLSNMLSKVSMGSATETTPAPPTQPPSPSASPIAVKSAATPLTCHSSCPDMCLPDCTDACCNPSEVKDAGPPHSDNTATHSDIDKKSKISKIASQLAMLRKKH